MRISSKVSVVKFFILLFFILLSTSFTTAKKHIIVVNAISSILDEYFSKTSWTTDVISFGEKNGLSENIVAKVLLVKNESSVIKVSQNVFDKSGGIRLNTSSILLFDSLEEFEKLKKRIDWQANIEKRTQHLVFVPSIKTKQLKSFQNDFSIDSVIFLSNLTETSIELITSFMFLPSACRTNRFETINIFNKTTMKWASSMFYPDKYLNFYGCPLLVANYLSGKTILIVRDISLHLNFTPVIVTSRSPQIFEKSDLWAWLRSRKHNELAGYPFVSQSLSLFTPLGELYTPLEQILLPFDHGSWVAICCTLLLFLIGIQVINRCPLMIKNFVYGNGIETPTINLISTFLTGAQYKIPRRNFARFLLILISLWCMIIRTCHQSLLFKYLQGDPRKASIKSFSEAIEKNFTFIAYYSDNYAKDEIEMAEFKGISKPNMKYMTASELKSGTLNYVKFNMIAEPSNRIVAFDSSTLHESMNAFYHSGFSSVLMTKENSFVSFVGFFFKPFNPFFEIMFTKTSHLHEAGITNSYMKSLFNPYKRTFKLIDAGPQILTLEHLNICFIIWTGFLAISIAVFCLEFANVKLRKFVIHVKDSLVAFKVVEALFLRD